MVKAEWGQKHTCPKCGTRFYDLGNNNPLHCINADCGNEWIPEPILKAKQSFASDKIEEKVEKIKAVKSLDDDDDISSDQDFDLDDDDIEIDDDEDDSVLADVSLDDDDADVSLDIDPKIVKDDD